MAEQSDLCVGIVGVGPRALCAIETLIGLALEREVNLSIDIYDQCPWPGAGPNYAPDQSALCLLNIPVRIVDYAPPDFLKGSIEPFKQWTSDTHDGDDFPPRSHIGQYLHERIGAIQGAIPDTVHLSHVREHIAGLEHRGETWYLRSSAALYGPYDEVLLAQGQPNTKPDPQLKRWTDHAEAHALDLLPAYPAKTVIDAAQDWSDKIVAVRGLGLSTLDVVRVLSKGLGGAFANGAYIPSGREPRRILPFSLNGKPPAAKPATFECDSRFDPTEDERRGFEDALSQTVSQMPDAALARLCQALIAPAKRILRMHGSVVCEPGIDQWLSTERDNPGAQNDRGPIEDLEYYIAMAHGRIAPDTGYVVGQLWRKLQQELRLCVNKGQHSVETRTALITFDEGLKRYSYGPPVLAAEELRALIEYGLVNLCIVDDPDIALTPEGWQLVEGDDEKLAPVMIDAVLPKPALDNVADTLLLDCIEKGFTQPIADGFGAHITTRGQLISATNDIIPNLCMLGRYTLGSVVAVDGLDDCFGPTTTQWAHSVMERHFAD